MTEGEPFAFFDHTADVGLLARGRDWPELFANAARGLTALLVDPPPEVESLRDRVRAEGPDREALFVNWLNELVYLHATQGFLVSSVRFRELTETVLDAEVGGEHRDPSRHRPLREVKAATYHGLSITQGPEGWTAKVIFDV